MKTTLVAICGPTAIGKTEVAIEYAQRHQTEIVSFDSRQFFKELSIGTAKPSNEELKKVPHHFVNSHSIQRAYNAGTYAQEANLVISDLAKKYSTIILVGGSGLYLQSLLYGFDSIPSINADTRQHIKKLFDEKGLEFLQQEILKHDAGYAATVDIHNPARLMRALEVFYQTGKPYTSFLAKKENQMPYKVEYKYLTMNRQELYSRINKRVDAMIEAGLEAECRSLLAYRNHHALQTVGYKEMFEYIDEDMTLEMCIDKIKQHTRNYAKRQITWFSKMVANA
ncbi:MAG: tRNA (adenosine(37)-N6)-dimethylallyltransferase MiaA [Bacteroidetes bacterium]|nr:tRNA (adenosine(37)-N6)-dimethylallyltransferase MiaA [Bacteroidota bacterium]